MMPLNKRYVGSRCAWCGKLEEEVSHIIVSTSMYDGEWCCSRECAEKHDEHGCPLKGGGE